ncbi:MAG: hypothetical protein RBR24_08355, partial [Candidatus Carbobacillus sp.]|nr:hypothetical protein [Candidatus Carbobacillus sp.]
MQTRTNMLPDFLHVEDIYALKDLISEMHDTEDDVRVIVKKDKRISQDMSNRILTQLLRHAQARRQGFMHLDERSRRTVIQKFLTYLEDILY